MLVFKHEALFKTEWNIKKFTNNRFQNIKLNENAQMTDKTYSIIKNSYNNPEISEDKTLIIFENNLSFENSDFKQFKFDKIILAVNSNEFKISN